MQGGYITAQHSVLTLREKWDLRTTVWLAGRGFYRGIIGRVDGALGRTLVGCGHVSRHRQMFRLETCGHHGAHVARRSFA